MGWIIESVVRQMVGNACLREGLGKVIEKGAERSNVAPMVGIVEVAVFEFE